MRKVGFTGGISTAQKVVEATAATVKNVTLELGGNDPAVVLDDADIDSTLERMLTGGYTRSGQICFAVKRIGHGLDPEASFGPLSNEAQFKKVVDLLDRTRNSSAELVQLGRTLDRADGRTATTSCRTSSTRRRSRVRSSSAPSSR